MIVMSRFRERRVFLPLASLIAVALLGAAPAHAGILLQVLNANAAPNSTGNFFDVQLFNTGPGAQNIAGFGIQVSVTDADISFDAAGTNMSTAQTYILAGDSFDAINAFAFASLNNPQTLLASDFSNSGAGTNVASLATFGLARVFFNVANGAALGNFNVALAAFPATSLSDVNGSNVTFTASDGTISILVPEPSFLLPLASVLLIGFVTHRFRAQIARC